MDKNLLNEVIACLPKERTLFRYMCGDYALMLLSRIAGDGVRIADIKQSAYGRLLSKPTVQKHGAEGPGNVAGPVGKG